MPFRPAVPGRYDLLGAGQDLSVPVASQSEVDYDLIGFEDSTGQPLDLEVSPNRLIAAYESSRIAGAMADRAHDVQFASVLDYPIFEWAAEVAGLAGSGEGKVSMPYLATLKFEPEFG